MLTFYSYVIGKDNTYYPNVYIENMFLSGPGLIKFKDGKMMFTWTEDSPPEGEIHYLYKPMTVDEGEGDEVILEKLLKQDTFSLVKAPVISKFSVRQKIYGIYEGLTESGWERIPFEDEFKSVPIYISKEAVVTSDGFIVTTDDEKAKKFVQSGQTSISNPPYSPYHKGFVYKLENGKVAIYIMW